MRRLAVLALLLCLGAAALPLRGQEKPPEPGARKPADLPFPPVTESVEVAVTSIEVIVTDSKGNRVPGLTAADFEVKQDGILQPITNFYAVTGGKVLLEDGTTIAIDAPTPAPPLPPELSGRYVFYVDNQNIQPMNRNRMFKRLREFIKESIGPNSEGMIVTYSRSLKVRKSFTSDPTELLGALDQIELDTGGGSDLRAEMRDAIAAINQARSADEGVTIARMQARSMKNDLEFTIDAFKESLDNLAGLSGRKIFIYMSEGLPQSPGYELFEAVREKFQDTTATMEIFEFDMSTKYVQIIQSANANGVTVYTLDASGLSTGGDLLSAESRTTDIHVNEFLARQNMQGPIQMIAEQTGGASTVNSNDWKAGLDNIAADYSNFYSLGYRSARGAADRPHRIEVSVKRKGLTVRTRTSFVEKSIETRTAESVVASLSYPRADNPLKASLSVGEPTPYDRDNYKLPVRISVPIGKLGLVPSGDQYEGQFFVYFVVRDAKGDQSDLQVQRQQIRIPAADFAVAQRKDFYYDATLLVVPGGQKLAVAVRDGVSNLVSYMQKSVFVSVLPKESKAAEPGKPGGR